MREIKFRGFSENLNNWVYGCLVNNMWYYSGLSNKKGNVCEIITGDYAGDCWEEAAYEEECVVEVVPESIGEYTGLKDMHGKEIYEGDILGNVEHNFKFKVQWGIEGESYAGWAGNWLDKDFISPLFNKPLENCEIIGNIYQNKELLK